MMRTQRSLITLATLVWAALPSALFANAVDAATTFSVCTDVHETEGSLHDVLTLNGWTRISVVLGDTVSISESELTPESLVAIFWFLTGPGMPRGSVEELKGRLTDEMEDRGGDNILSAFISHKGVVYSGEEALLSVSVIHHPNWTKISCNFIGRADETGAELIRSLQFPVYHTELIRWTRIPTDGTATPLLGGLVATGKQKLMEAVFERELPELSLFSVTTNY